MGVPPPGIRNDPLALAAYLRDHAAGEISGNVNAWIMLVEGSGMRMKRSTSPRDREASGRPPCWLPSERGASR